LHKVLCTIILQPFAVESQGIRQNAQTGSLSMSQCKFSISWLNILCNERHHLHVNMAPLTVQDRLLIKTLETEKGWIVEKK